MISIVEILDPTVQAMELMCIQSSQWMLGMGSTLWNIMDFLERKAIYFKEICLSS